MSIKVTEIKRLINHFGVSYDDQSFDVKNAYTAQDQHGVDREMIANLAPVKRQSSGTRSTRQRECGRLASQGASRTKCGSGSRGGDRSTRPSGTPKCNVHGFSA